MYAIFVTCCILLYSAIMYMLCISIHILINDHNSDLLPCPQIYDDF